MMNAPNRFYTLRILTALSILLLTACGGGGNTPPVNSAPTTSNVSMSGAGGNFITYYLQSLCHNSFCCGS